MDKDIINKDQQSLSVEAEDIGLFNDDIPVQKVASKQKVCSICDLELGGKVVRDNFNNEVHESCVKDMIVSGSYNFDDVELAEINNSIEKHAWMLQHPDVVREGCLFCRGNLSGPVVKIARSPMPYFVHRECLAKAIRTAKISGEDLKEILSMNYAHGLQEWFETQKWTCVACLNDVENPIVLPSGQLTHKECLRKRLAEGKVEDWELIKICNINGLEAAQFEDATSIAKSEAKLPELLKEAENILQQVWDKFASWLRSLGGKVVAAYDAYGEELADLETALGIAESQSVAASLEKSAIEEEIQEAMQILARIEQVEAERKAKLDAIMQEYQIAKLKDVKKELALKVKAYLEKLVSRQRKFEDAMFRIKDQKHRSAFSSKEFMAALKETFAQSKKTLDAITELEDAATHTAYTTQELEVILQPEEAPAGGEVQ